MRVGKNDQTLREHPAEDMGQGSGAGADESVLAPKLTVYAACTLFPLSFVGSESPVHQPGTLKRHTRVFASWCSP
jgi:hypothetical protein